MDPSSRSFSKSYSLSHRAWRLYPWHGRRWQRKLPVSPSRTCRAVSSPPGVPALNCAKLRSSLAEKAIGASRSVGGGFGGGMHAVLGDFVNAAGGRLNTLAIEMIERNAAFADGVALFDGFGDISFGERSGLEQGAASGKLRGKCRGKGAACTVQGLFFHAVAGELKDFRAVKEHVVGALHVAAFDDYGSRAHLDDLASGGFHVGNVFDGQPSENFRFGNVRGNDAGTLQEFGGDVLDSCGVEEFRTAGGLHHGVMNDVGKFVGIEEFS